MRPRGFSSIEVLLCGAFLCAFAAWGYAEAARTKVALERAKMEEAMTGLVDEVAAGETGRVICGGESEGPTAPPPVERRVIVNGRPVSVVLRREEVESCPGLTKVIVEAVELETGGGSRRVRLATGARQGRPGDSR